MARSDDPYRTPAFPDASEKLVLLRPRLRHAFLLSLILCGVVLGIAALFMPKFTARVWWVILLEMVPLGCLSWVVGWLRARPLFQAMKRAKPETGGTRILCAGAARESTAKGFGRDQWIAVYLTEKELLIGGTFVSLTEIRRRISLSEIEALSGSGNTLRGQMKEGEPLWLHLPKASEWRLRIEKARGGGESGSQGLR